MRKSFLSILPLALLLAFADVRETHAQAAPADAGAQLLDATDVATGSGSGAAGAAVGSGRVVDPAPAPGTPAAPTVTPAPGAPAVDLANLPDVTKDPLGFMASARAAWSKSWGVGVALAVLGLLELLAYAGTKKSVAWMAWFGVGRVSLIIAGLSGIMPTFIAALSGSTTWAAFWAVLVPAVAAYWHHAGTDPASAVNPVSGNVTAVK